jgi:hypothetical protein
MKQLNRHHFKDLDLYERFCEKKSKITEILEGDKIKKHCFNPKKGMIVKQ